MLTNTDALLDKVLDSMPVDQTMTLAEVHDAFFLATGYTVTADEIRHVLERLNYLNAEGREVEIRTVVGVRVYCRPIVVGMACTICYLTDRRAATVAKVSPTARIVMVRMDKAIRTDKNGMSESQTYTYERDPSGAEYTFHRQGDGSYHAPGKTLVLGVRRTYHDYSY
jgi:hypothetical protein